MLSIPGSKLQLSSAGFICTNFFYFIRRQLYLHFTYWITRLSLFSTSEKVLQPSSELTFFIVKDLACFAALCLGLSLLNTLVRVYSVFMCCCSAAFSASFAISSVHFLLSTLTCLLTSLSFCLYSFCHLCFGLSDLAPISFCLIWFSLVYQSPSLLTEPWLVFFSCTLVPPLPF